MNTKRTTNDKLAVLFIYGKGDVMFKKYYRCRLCGKIVKKKLRIETYESIDIKILNDSGFIRNEIHFCDDKNIGILEFLGVKMENNI